MKIALYSPYLDTAGGGEKYILTIAEILSRKAQVEVLLDRHLNSVGPDKLKQLNKRIHGLDLSNVNFRYAPIGSDAPVVKKLIFLKQYDFLFYNTDGSIFLSGAKKSIIHFQMPFDDKGIKGFSGKIKLSSWEKAIYNSDFTREYIERFWPIKGEVIYPPVDVTKMRPLTKKRIILSVGRFVKATKVKKHDEMVEAFKVLSKQLKGWKLCLAGGVAEGDEDYLRGLKDRSSGYDINFLPNISIEDLRQLYGHAMIYWHFMGLNEEDPKKYEHFGITTVEAMASGCVPIVINKGGQKEIVEDRNSGFLWDKIEDLYNLTLEVSQNSSLANRISKQAIERSHFFSSEKFKDRIEKLIYG